MRWLALKTRYVPEIETVVIPAKAGIQYPNLLDIPWIPAFAGMTDF